MIIDVDQVHRADEALSLRSRMWGDAQQKLITEAQLFEALRALRRKFGADYYDARPRAANTRGKS